MFVPDIAVQQSVFLLCLANSSSVTCNNFPLVPEIFGVLFIVRIQSIKPCLGANATYREKNNSNLKFISLAKNILLELVVYLLLQFVLELVKNS